MTAVERDCPTKKFAKSSGFAFGMAFFIGSIRILLCGCVVVSESQYSRMGDRLAVFHPAASHLFSSGGRS